MHHIAPGDPAKLGIDRRRKALESSLVAAAPGRRRLVISTDLPDAAELDALYNLP